MDKKTSLQMRAQQATKPTGKTTSKQMTASSKKTSRRTAKAGPKAGQQKPTKPSSKQKPSTRKTSSTTATNAPGTAPTQMRYSFPPPVSPRPEQLPLSDPNWTWEGFQAFCLELVSRLPITKESGNCHHFGKQGDAQDGIDLSADMEIGQHWGFQCKKQKRFTEADNDVVDQLCGVFSTIEAFFDASDLSALEIALQSGLERAKFGVQDDGPGSWRGILAGTRRAFEFAKDKLDAFFAILAGKGERLAEAFVRTKEAEAEHKQSDAAVAKEKARQEQLETLARAMEVAKQLQTQIADLRTDMPHEQRVALLEQYLLPPMERMGVLLLENNLTMEISPDQTANT